MSKVTPTTDELWDAVALLNNHGSELLREIEDDRKRAKREGRSDEHAPLQLGRRLMVEALVYLHDADCALKEAHAMQDERECMAAEGRESTA